MALFGKKKTADEAEELENEVVEQEEETEEQTDAADSDETAEGAAAEETPEEEKTPEELFKDRCALLARRMRLMFPKNMLIGFYYAELQAEGYIDDFCCYTNRAERINRDEIPEKLGMSLPDMVSREEKLEQAFFLFRRAAEAYTEKSCNAVSLTMLNDGQVKIDITSEPLVEGEEDIRYGKWLDMIDKTELRPVPPPAQSPVQRKIPEEKLKVIQETAHQYYQELGTEFFSFQPEADFKIAYFYAEVNENGVFYHNRLIMNDGEIIDGDDIFGRFGMDAEKAAASRVEIVKALMKVRSVFEQNGEMPFTNATLSVTAKGEFSSSLAFNPVSAATEQDRLEAWKEAHKE